MRKRPKKQWGVQDTVNGSSRDRVAMQLSADATFPLMDFELFETRPAKKQLSGAVDLALYHNLIWSLSDSESDFAYIQDWMQAAQETPEDVSLIQGILLEDALVAISQTFSFVKSKPLSTANPETWTYIIDALCCAGRLSCSPSFRSNEVPEIDVPGAILTVARLCDGVFRLANRHSMESVPSSCADLPNVPPDDWTECIYKDIVCGRSSAWIALAKINAWQIGKRWPKQHEVYAAMRALFLQREMRQYQEDSDERGMAEALDLAILAFAKTYRDISVKNRVAGIATNSLDVFPHPVDVIAFDIPELNGGYGDIFGVDPLEQVAFLSRRYREAFLIGS